MNYFTGDWLSDNAIMFDFLEDVHFYSGSERRRMLSVSEKVGGSMLYGLTWKGYLSKTKNRTIDPSTGLYKTKVMDDYPKLAEIFKEFAELHFPNHVWEQVQMNKNFPCPPHTDSSNITSSILCCFGDYEGGETSIEYPVGIQSFNPRLRPLSFNGAKYKHWVEPIKSGTRYSLVFFSNSSVRNIIEKKKKEKKNISFKYN